MRSWSRYRNLAALLAAGVLLAVSAPAPEAQSRSPLFTEMAPRRLPRRRGADPRPGGRDRWR